MRVILERVVHIVLSKHTAAIPGLYNTRHRSHRTISHGCGIYANKRQTRDAMRRCNTQQTTRNAARCCSEPSKTNMYEKCDAKEVMTRTRWHACDATHPEPVQRSFVNVIEKTYIYIYLFVYTRETHGNVRAREREREKEKRPRDWRRLGPCEQRLYERLQRRYEGTEARGNC